MLPFCFIGYLPADFLPSAARPVDESLFGFSEDGKVTLVSYVPKHKKAVVLMSSMHADAEVDPDTQKPRIILDYNKTKGNLTSRHCSSSYVLLVVLLAKFRRSGQLGPLGSGGHV